MQHKKKGFHSQPSKCPLHFLAISMRTHYFGVIRQRTRRGLKGAKSSLLNVISSISMLRLLLHKSIPESFD